MDSADYVVVGAGAAGCALAARLSADPAVRVVLLEAGPADRSPLIHVPAGFTRLGEKYDWRLWTTPQAELDGRQVRYPLGRTLGGGTSVNAMIYIRGQAADYDQWAELGNADWSYEQVLPFFRRAEANDRLNDRYHGSVGAVGVCEQPERNTLSKAFLRAAQELGFGLTTDFNGARQGGAGWFDVTQRHGRRQSTARAYLGPTRHRPNLEVRTATEVHRVVVEHGRAVGVRLPDGTVLRADREVILAAGAVHSPRLLLLSGIGPAAHLDEVGIPVVHELPGVGVGLQDHLETYVAARTVPLGYGRAGRPDRVAVAVLEYLLTRRGLLAASVCEAGLFLRSDGTQERPDLQLQVLPTLGIDRGRSPLRGDGVTINSCHLRPRSRGSVRLQSGEPGASALVDPGYLTDPADWEPTLAGIEWSRRLLRSAAMKPFVTAEVLPTREADARAHVRQWARTAYHPVGSCRMGTDPDAVVDQRLRVHGLDGLRVVDASVMPTLISGNTMAAATMIGERGAHLIMRGEVPPDPRDGPC